MLRYARDRVRQHPTYPYLKVVDPEPHSLRIESRALATIQAEAPNARIVAAYVHMGPKKVLAGVCVGTTGKMLWMDYLGGKFINPRLMKDTTHWVTSDAIRHEICADKNTDVFIRLIRRG